MAVDNKPEFRSVTYVKASARQVWEALTSAEATGRFWGHSNVSTWEVGARWEHVRTDGSGIADVVGEVLVADAPRCLKTSWDDPGNEGGGFVSYVTMTIDEFHDIARLTVLHERLRDNAELELAAHGWAAVLSNLKTFLEIGDPLPQAPWLMPK